ncbi:hypothetical protein Taro_046138 [Colocasia esculenta]|uniref:SOUL heme-binding protein n=1 Tax=Colocasia esculenta TaxID=4460 RepID=A0A843WRF8_COLES|nr:hypothetical protein [Colocasia esculenta]
MACLTWVFLLRGCSWVLLVMLLSCREGAVVGSYVKPSSCDSLECPSYRVVHYEENLEIRSYDKAVWMATPPINSTSYTEASNLGFLSLFAYIQGKNEQGAKIEMTTPVLVDIIPSTGPFCNSNFVVRFYVPRAHQKAPPRSDKVRPETWPGPRYAAVRRFGGFLNDANIPVEAAALRSSLHGTPWEAAAGGGGARPARYTVAGYNSPFEFQNRVNEVMFLF